MARTVGPFRRWIRRIWVGAGLTFVSWQFWTMQSHNVDDALLASSDAVTVVDSEDVIRFTPAHGAPNATGLIFLPGAMVQPKAYVPLLRAVAESGHPVVLVRLPWRTAPSASARATVWERIAETIATSPHPWMLGGHSRGGALAAQFAGEHASSLAGLILIGTTHPKAASLATLQQPVTKIFGTRDCVADTTAMHANAKLLPPSTRWVEIDGGNHSQFGWYGRQLGDCDATITREVQQSQLRDAVVAALSDTSRAMGK